MTEQEFERRFLVSDQRVLQGTSSVVIEQGYLWARGGYAIRIRRTRPEDGEGTASDDPGVFALKGPRTHAHRLEHEVLLPAEHVTALLQQANYRVVKRRHALIFRGDLWSIDVFLEQNEGLIIAEFEGSEQAVASVVQPHWCSREVTDERGSS